MAATTEQIKQLREMTGAGVLEAKRVLDANNGDFDKSLEQLKAKGIASASKKADRVAHDGLIESYIHAGGKVGVLLEINCETDFVARTDVFRQLAHDIALQITAQSPQYVSPQDIPADLLAEKKKTFEDQARSDGKPAAMIDRIIAGKLDKFYDEVCLLRQPFIRDDSVKIKDLIDAAITKTGENIVVRRFTRYALGE